MSPRRNHMKLCSPPATNNGILVASGDPPSNSDLMHEFILIYAITYCSVGIATIHGKLPATAGGQLDPDIRVTFKCRSDLVIGRSALSNVYRPVGSTVIRHGMPGVTGRRPTCHTGRRVGTPRVTQWQHTAVQQQAQCPGQHGGLATWQPAPRRSTGPGTLVQLPDSWRPLSKVILAGPRSSWNLNHEGNHQAHPGTQ